MSPSQTNSISQAATNDNQAPSLARIPEYISLTKWEDTGFEWQGEVDRSYLL